jgi:hypothetical protein
MHVQSVQAYGGCFPVLLVYPLVSVSGLAGCMAVSCSHTECCIIALVEKAYSSY